MTSKRLTRHCHAMRHNQSNLIFSLLGAQCFKTARKMSHLKVSEPLLSIFSDFLMEKMRPFLRLFPNFCSSFCSLWIQFFEVRGTYYNFRSKNHLFFFRPISSAWMMLMNFPDIFYFYYKPLEANKRSCLDTYLWTNEQMCHLTCFHIF